MDRDDTGHPDMPNVVRIKQCSLGRRLGPMAKWTDLMKSPDAIAVIAPPNLRGAPA
ncbi:hypothetical protein [Nocardia sp. NPDC005366]|uniref:hypothetical protein n=1 Tax=Nocardia sp. NPDC005366 TaxID=3156878 RepID=UPI0033A9EEAF